MAEVVLLNIVAGLVANIASEPFKKIRLSLGVKDELRKLNNTLTVIKAVLRDAEEKQTRDEQVKVWLDRLEEVIYDADNLVDEFHYQHLRRKVLFSKKKARKVRIFFSRSSNQLFFRYKMAKKLKKIRQTLDEIKADQVFVHILKPDSEETRGPSKLSERETHSFVIDEEVIGRDDEKNDIKELLLANDIENNENVSIVSLVGISGLGKTTLAKFVFNDEEIKKHFEKQTYWVCVSDDFDLKSLVQKIIRSVTGKSPDQNLDLEQLQKQLREKIEGNKYLLVLDDVWNEDSDKWEKLSTFLSPGAKGSKVLITTRSQKVARIVHSTKTYMLGGLDEHKSWALFERAVFGEINYERTDRLVEIGKDIVKKCGGVPLAIKTIGRLLYENQPMQNRESQWTLFRDNKLAEIYNKNQNDILLTLKLSYDNLPSDLKNCFAFCSLFPKGYVIDVQQLIKLWMAQGFIEKDGSSSQLEVIGYDNFMILFSRCFFQEAEQDELLGTVKSCKMHDLMHDLASLVAGKSIKILDENIEEQSFEKVCHVFGLKYDCLGHFKTQLLEQKKMRTFILCKFESLTSSDCNGIFSNLKLLRALSFRIESNTETLPNSLSKLKHLRYLNLSSNKLKELPNSITELYNLHTLILSNCACLVSLPVDIKNLINLRHLEIYGCRELTHMPRGIGELTLLQTLDMFVVAANQSRESAGFGELGKLNNLRGRLVIQIKGLGESGAAQCLKNKKHLESLVLNWEVEQDTIGNAEEALKCSELHQDMKALEVNSYPGETFPPNWLSSLTNLVQLSLVGFKECKYLPPLHHLSSLRNLELDDLSALEFVSNRDREWDQGFHLSTSSRSFLPSLKSLKITECTSLKGWWVREIKDVDEVVRPLTEHHHQHPFFPSLTTLEISNCPLLNTMPLFPYLEELKISNTSFKPLEQTIMMKLKSDGVATTSSASSSSSSSFPLSKLRALDIYNASDFQSLPKAIENLSSLAHLSIIGCSNLASLPEEIGSLSSLADLTIKECSNLVSLPEGIGNLASLTGLTIQGCSNLASLPEGIGSLSSLTNLTIRGCSNLTSLPERIGSLSSLKNLTIRECSNLASLPEGIGSLSSLIFLIIGGCSNLASLPEGICSLSSLAFLTIKRCSNFASLPEGIGSLSSLTSLIIEECSNLTSLPEGIGSLPSLRRVNKKSCTQIPMNALANYLLQQSRK